MNPPDLEIRVPLGLGYKLISAINQSGRHEQVAFCLVAQARIANKEVLLVQEVLTLPERAYLKDDSVGGAWRGSDMLPAIQAAMLAGNGLLLVHAHPKGFANLSRPDEENARRLLPMFQRRVPSATHGSIVIAGTQAGGVLTTPDSTLRRVNPVLRLLGASIMDWGADVESRDGIDEHLDGSLIASQGRLQRWRVAVVGLSGGGGHVVQQLARLGVGTIIGIDDDLAENRNAHKIVGLKPDHLSRQARKVDVMEELVREASCGARFVAVPHRVPSPEALEALKSADVIVGCLDNLHTRADLQEIAWRFAIPYIDIGVSIRISQRGLAIAAGNVLTLIPGGFCMWCAGFLSDLKLREELGTARNRSYLENRTGEAQVISFNGLVASQAVNEVLQLLTGFNGQSIDPQEIRAAHDPSLQRGYRKFDSTRGELRDWGARRRDDCRCCGSLLGRAAVNWAIP